MKKIVSAVLLILLVGCAADNKIAVESHYKLGLAYLNTENDYMAIAEFEKALALSPNDDKVLYASSAFYLKKGKPEEALKYLLKALEVKPNNSEYLNAYASILAMKGRSDDAVNIWLKILNDPTYPYPDLVYYNIGYLRMQNKQYGDAELYLRKSIDVNQKVISPYMALFTQYKETRDFKKAEEILLKAQKNNPLFVPIKFELAKFYYDIKSRDKAMNLFNEIIRMSPGSTQAVESAEYLKKMGL